MDNFRTIDGSGNNPNNFGESGAELRRLLNPAYGSDGEIDDLPRGITAEETGNPFIGPSSLPNPREISNTIADQTESVPNYLDTSDWIWQWGQFLDHDLDLNEGTGEPFFIPLAPDDFLVTRGDFPANEIEIEQAGIVSASTTDGEEQLIAVQSNEELITPLFNDTPVETISLEELMTSEEFVITDEFAEDLEEEFDLDLSVESVQASESDSNDSPTVPEDIPFITFARIPDADESEPLRQYVNEITSFIDGSQVYGSEAERAEFLRANDGTGKLKSQTIDGEELLPQEDPELLSERDDPESFAAGDARVNEQGRFNIGSYSFLERTQSPG